MAKLTEYQYATRFDSGDILIKDGANGTKKMTAANAAIELAGLVSAINHRNVWRGKSLGSAVSAQHKTAIQNGSFDDLFIGDYWTINNVNWRIHDMDYFLNCGDTALAKHHLVILPDTCLVSGEDAKMNNTGTTEGGYTGSLMYNTTMEKVKKKVTEAFSDMVLRHREYLVNAMADGHPSTGAWADSTVELPNEIMVYGCPIFTPSNNGNVISAQQTLGKTQLAGFRLNPLMIKQGANYWLRDAVSAFHFAVVHATGYANYYDASLAASGVRPYFLIG